MYSQERVISGTVVSEDSSPLPGVNVLIKNTTKGVLTDFDGKYSISAKIGDVLIFSYLGMTTREITVGDSASIDVTLKAENNLLDEVVVVAYGTTTLRESTGSISSVKADDILNESPVVSVQNSLQGNVSGIQVGSTSGQPGSFPSVRLRGVGSINATSNPLYIIDGVPVVAGDQSNFTTSTSNVLSTLNPNDIESMTVLKDAASASLYGARAANGVIVITTKKGKQGKTVFEFKSSYGESDVAFRNSDREMVDGDTYRDLTRESIYNLFHYVQGNDVATSNEQADFYLEQLFPVPEGGYTNWKDVLFRKGSIKSHQFSARGGDEKTRFFASLSAHDEEAIVYESDFIRYTINSNIDHKANNNISFGLNTTLGFTKQNSVPDQGLYYANPYTAYLISYNPTDPTRNSLGELLPSIQNQYPNPEKERGLTEQSSKQIRFSATPYLQVKFTDWLTFKTTNSWAYYFNTDNLYWGPTSNDGSSFNGYAYRAHNTISTLTTSNTLNFVKTFNDVHNLNVMAGFEVSKTEYDDFSADVQNFPNAVLKDFTTAAEELDTDTNFQEDKLISYISRAQYNYNNKYFLSGSLRYDGSSRMSEDNRYGTFWSVSGGWVITEDLFKENTFIDYLKLRGSYGTSATYPNSFTGALPLYAFSASYNDQTAAFPSQLANPNLTWETNKNFDIGLEFELLNKKVSGSLEYYNRFTEDLLQDVPILTTTGFSTILQNVGEMSNKGFELSITTNNIDKDNFKWTTTITGATNKNVIEKLYDGDDIQLFPHILREGESRYTFYLREAKGVNSETGQWEWYKNTTNSDGDIISGRETTSVSGEAESTIVGKWDPDFYGGIRNNLKYKDFDLSFLFNYNIGGQTYDSYAYYLNNDGSFPFQGIPKGQTDRWQQPGDVAANPMRVFNNSSSSNFQSSRRLHDATYLRLKDITIGYNLPKKILEQTGVFSNVRLSLNGTNLVTWAKDKSYDPESQVGGATGTSIPYTKTYTFNVQLQF
ncbi:SusC/RagA family TonB-linked outer membrane protein [Lutibacter aestuarii]|uniref:SusC/RagA family TonB-linked outer membrane protein n=1 Tax=Lutibacter aestuarii TaxID=861111 RepID=A0ABW2Z246_9FLAO|nr:TonB-dependent receptor [uncultured Lutibacter sp.]